MSTLNNQPREMADPWMIQRFATTDPYNRMAVANQLADGFVRNRFHRLRMQDFLTAKIADWLLSMKQPGFGQGSPKTQRKPCHAVRTRCADGTRSAGSAARDTPPPRSPDCGSAPARTPETNCGTGDTLGRKRTEIPCR